MNVYLIDFKNQFDLIEEITFNFLSISKISDSSNSEFELETLLELNSEPNSEFNSELSLPFLIGSKFSFSSIFLFISLINCFLIKS